MPRIVQIISHQTPAWHTLLGLDDEGRVYREEQWTWVEVMPPLATSRPGRKGVRPKLTDAQLEAIRKLSEPELARHRGQVTQEFAGELANRFGVSPRTIRRIIHGR